MRTKKMYKKLLYLLMFILFFIGLSFINNIIKIGEPEKLWEQIKEFRTQKKLQNAITNCKTIQREYPNTELAATAIFQIGDIYLNDVQDYDFAIDYFKEVLEKYPNSKESEKAAFMIGYIYANNLVQFFEPYMRHSYLL